MISQLWYLLLVGSLMLSGCSAWKNERTPEDIVKSGTLVVATRNASTTYFKDKDGDESGFEYDLVSAFADHLGVKIEWQVKETLGEVLQALESGEADIAAAGLTRTKERSKVYLMSDPYMNIRQKLICGPRTKIKKVVDLESQSVVVVKDSSYEEKLAELKRTTMPKLDYFPNPDLTSEQLLQMVWDGAPDCTVADSNIVDSNRRFMPELRIVGDLSEQQELAWFMSKKNVPLLERVNQWLQESETKILGERLEEKYYGHADEFDYYDLKVFKDRIQTRLPQYKKYFKQAGKRYGIPWKLLAAVAYQESHWNPKSTSPTGVRGIMMLTKRTAKEVGVDDRLDPVKSIFGGARYLARLLRRIPRFIPSVDRRWMALASYNVGFGHLQDGRKIAIDLNFNPNRWDDVRKVLPLLSQQRYFRYLRYGYARGSEPVIYVIRVQNYFQILNKTKI